MLNGAPNLKRGQGIACPDSRVPNTVVLLEQVTGEDFTAGELVEAASRVKTLEHAYNAREGMRRIYDYPFFLRWEMETGEPHPLFTADKVKLTLENYDAVLNEWYNLRGFDPVMGIPRKGTLERFGLLDVAEDLRKRETFKEQTQSN